MEAQGDNVFSNVYCNFGGKLLQFLPTYNNQASKVYISSCQLFLVHYRRMMSTCIQITFHSLNNGDTQFP